MHCTISEPGLVKRQEHAILQRWGLITASVFPRTLYTKDFGVTIKCQKI